MIIYFADRKLNILGLASTNIGTGYSIVQDKKTENIENGVVIFDVTVFFDNEKRREIESYCEAGNYILRSSGGEAEFYTIIDEEIDSEEQTITLYCEDAGMDLLNGIAGKFEATEAHPIAWYFDQWLKGTGFTIGVNEISSLSRKLKWDGESTITERLASVANQFDNAEISYTFQIDRLKVSAMHVNIYKKRGADAKVKLRVGVELEKINIKKSVADIATALKCTGGTPEGQENPITLAGYSFDDGDFYVSGDMVCCRSALKKWGRLGTTQHIVKTYSFDTTSQAELCAHAVTKLKEIKDTTFALTASIIKLPSGVGVGDRVIIVNEGEGLYISTRLLTLGTSVTTGDKSATFGEFIAQDPGITAQVQAIAEKISAIATSKADALAAAKAAEEARKKAEAAKSAADSASKTATTASETANTANDTAKAASETANNASTKANEAAGKVDNMQNRMDSGEFKGEKGEKGDAGPPGHTPEKGKDYFTNEDKKEMEDAASDAAVGQISERLDNLDNRTSSNAKSIDDLNNARNELGERIVDVTAKANNADSVASQVKNDLANYKELTSGQIKTLSNFMAQYNLSFRQDKTGFYITNTNPDGSQSNISLRLSNDRISFMSGTSNSAYEVAYIQDKYLYIKSGEFLTSLRLGNYGYVVGSNGDLSFKLIKKV